MKKFREKPTEIANLSPNWMPLVAGALMGVGMGWSAHEQSKATRYAADKQKEAADNALKLQQKELEASQAEINTQNQAKQQSQDALDSVWGGGDKRKNLWWKGDANGVV